METNGKVKWKEFVLTIGIGTAILGVLWNAIIKVQDDVVEIKVNTAETRIMLDALIGRINGGDITIKNNTGLRPMK